jgi:hypothetical protein
LLVADGIDALDVPGAAADAHLRDFDMRVPSDGRGSTTAQCNLQARVLPRQRLSVDTRVSRRP